MNEREPDMPSDMPVVVVDGTVVHVQRAHERSTHRCATRRVAQALATRLQLEAAGWRVDGPSTAWAFRRPLLLPGEHCGQPLDGSRSVDRAIGLVCWRHGHSARSAADLLVIDASADLPAAVLDERGDTAEARLIAAWHLEPLP